MTAKPLHICYLPWAELPATVTVGPVRFVPLTEWLLTVTDAKVVRFWERYARCHVGQDGKQVKSITIAVHAKADFGAPSSRQVTEISRAADALAFAYLAGGCMSYALPENRRSGGIPIAKPDRFALYSKSFSPGDRFVAISSGSVIGGWSLAQLRHQRPPHIASGWCEEPERELLAGLGRIVRCGPRHPFANQIWRALEWTRMAFSGADGVIETTRLVLMMTAYECLLAKKKGSGTGGGEVKRAFTEFVSQHLLFKGLRTKIRDFGKHGRPALPLPADWFYVAFGLRGKIVHGDVLRSDQGAYNKHPHLLLAVLFMWTVVKAQLADAALLPSSHRDPLRRAFRHLTGKPGNRRHHIVNDFKNDNLRRLYRALGWLRKRPGPRRATPPMRIVWT